MSATDVFESGILELILQNVDTNLGISNIGSGLQGSTTPGSLFVALFTGDPGEAASIADEAQYTGYARVGVARTAAEWAVAGGEGSNVNPVIFPQATGGSETLTHFAIMTALAGGQMLFYGPLDANLIISTNVTPEFAAGDVKITAD